MNKSKLLVPVLYSMAEGYNNQLIKYQEMLILSELQRDYVQEGNMVKFEEVILARQELITELEEMNNKLQPLKEEIISTLGLKDFSGKALLAAIPFKATEILVDVLGKLGEVLYAIKELDLINEKLLREKLSEADNKLNVIQKRNEAQKAYSKNKPKASSRYIDENK